jgi:hypothetical protein
VEVEDFGMAQLVVILPADGVDKRGKCREQEGQQQETVV